MKKIEILKNKIKSLREEAGQDGFSLLELVVAVGILLVLTVGGLLAYNGITDNARQAAVDSAASEIYTAASAYESDNDSGTDAARAAAEWNATSKDDSIVAEAGTNAAGEVGVKVTRASGEDVTHESIRGAEDAVSASELPAG